MAKRKRTRTIKVHGVSLDLDETATHYLVYVSPSRDLAARGISSHRSRLRKCACPVFSGVNSRCRTCSGWSAEGSWRYAARLLRSYPKLTVVVEVAA